MVTVQFFNNVNFAPVIKSFMKKFLLSLLCCCSLFYACTKDRIFDTNSNITVIAATQNNPYGGAIKINEFMANETLKAPSLNEYDSASDWIELYNTTGNDITIGANQWFVDSLGTPAPNTYALPAMTFPAHGFLVLWCDKLNKESTNPDPNKKYHTPYKLKKASGTLQVTYKDATDTLRLIDQVIYGAQQTDISYGRNPDGSSQWQFFTTPTPGKTNN